MVPAAGFELATYRLQGGCSTPELSRHGPEWTWRGRPSYPSEGRFIKPACRAMLRSDPPSRGAIPWDHSVRPAMPNPLNVALIQNCAERDMAPSIAALESLIRAAAKDKAQFILLPEMAA